MLLVQLRQIFMRQAVYVCHFCLKLVDGRQINWISSKSQSVRVLLISSFANLTRLCRRYVSYLIRCFSV